MGSKQQALLSLDVVDKLAIFYGVTHEQVLDAFLGTRWRTIPESSYTEPITWGQMYTLRQAYQDTLA